MTRAAELNAMFADKTVTLARVIQTYQRWMHLPDATPLYAVLGAVAANLMPGDAVWLLLVGAPSVGKTELLNGLLFLPYVHQAATLTEASLLSGTPKRDVGEGAKGGLLRVIGDFGIVVCKDFGSILSMHRDALASTLAALREVYDGTWTRHVGVDGGRTLHWEGKVGLIAGCTPSIDRHHAVIAAMGERFLMCRIPTGDADAQAQRALDHIGHEHAMRAELSAVVRDLFASIDTSEAPAVQDEDRERLITLASLVVRCRSAVERDGYTREVELIPESEAPGRMVTVLARLLGGLALIGADEATRWRTLTTVALDSMPAIRRRILKVLSDRGQADTSVVAVDIGYPTTPTRRALEDLTAHGIVIRDSQGQGKADRWQLSDWALDKWAAVKATVPDMQETHIYHPSSFNNENRERSPLVNGHSPLKEHVAQLIEQGVLGVS